MLWKLRMTVTDETVFSIAPGRGGMPQRRMDVNAYSSGQYDGINEYLNKLTVENLESHVKEFKLYYMAYGESDKCAMEE